MLFFEIKERISGALGMARKVTSISDNIEYPEFCFSAANEEQVFDSFRANPIYKTILEHVDYYQGNAYLEIIINRPSFINVIGEIEKFQKNDDYGAPALHKYQQIKSPISPTTLRYLKVLSDLIDLYDLKNVKSIAEIGIGYGGQGRIIAQYMPLKQYDLIDLPEVLLLANKYLKQYAEYDKFNFHNGNELRLNGCWDLVISNYAFSELSKAVQKNYLEVVILNSKRGYITWNSLSYKCLDGYSKDELLAIIPGSKIISEDPLTSDDNCIIIWNNCDF